MPTTGSIFRTPQPAHCRESERHHTFDALRLRRHRQYRAPCRKFRRPATTLAPMISGQSAAAVVVGRAYSLHAARLRCERRPADLRNPAIVRAGRPSTPPPGGSAGTPNAAHTGDYANIVIEVSDGHDHGGHDAVFDSAWRRWAIGTRASAVDAAHASRRRHAAAESCGLSRVLRRGANQLHGNGFADERGTHVLSSWRTWRAAPGISP